MARNVNPVRGVDLATRVAYYQHLAQAAPVRSLLRASARKLVRAAARAAALGAPRDPTPLETERAAHALALAPGPFPAVEPERRQVLEAELGVRVADLLADARRAAAGEVEVFGRWAQVHQHYRDPLSGRWLGPEPDPNETRAADSGATAQLGPGPGDPKGAWEVARMGHLVELGAAAALAPGCAAAMRQAFCDQLGDFAACCPPGVGLHWSSPLEASLRAIHVIAAFHLLGGAAALGPAKTRHLAALLWGHGRCIAFALEDDGVVQGNHLFANLVALLWLGIALGEPTWTWRARRRLGSQIARQVHEDGASFEGSTGYHRFVLELAVAAGVMSRAARTPLGASFWARLGRMFHFVRGYLLPDGTDPGIGDADDARVLPFARRDPHDHAYLLPIGAMLLGDPALKPPGGAFSVEALWLGGLAGFRRWSVLPAAGRPRSAAFPRGGLYVMRQGDEYLAVRCGPSGQDGVGGHSHNDQLSLVACAGGGRVVVDPGTGCYGLDGLWRDHFRGSAAHATVVVDGQEQSPLSPRPFALFDRARARARIWQVSPERDRFVGEQRGYGRLGRALVHRREVNFDKRLGAFIITDLLAGSGWHQIEIGFPLPTAEARVALGPAALARLAQVARGQRAPCGSALAFDRRLALELGPAAAPLAVLAPLANQGLALEVIDALQSPRYGEVVATRSVRYYLRASLPCVITIAIIAIARSEEGR
jgi:hypothetical protein